MSQDLDHDAFWAHMDKQDRLDGPEKDPQFDMVKVPKHYQIFRGIEAQDVMEVVAESHLCQHLTPWEIHCFMTMLKYRLRLGEKDDPLQDLAKANRYKHCLHD